MTKRLFVLLAACMALLCAVAFVGCGGNDEARSSADDVTQMANAGTANDMGVSSAKALSRAAAPAVSDNRAAEFALNPNAGTEWRTKSDGTNTIWMTFDDGPSENTQEVLDILDRYGVKATFFVTNINPGYAPMIKRAYEAGHTIGLHTYSHEYADVYASKTAYFADLDAIGAVVEEQIGFVPCFIRFPGGSSNTVSKKYTPGIMTALAADVQERGYQYFDWNISCGDGADGHTSDEIAQYATEDEDYTNVMLLMHDGAGKATTVAALPEIIEHYQAEGYTFKAIDREAFACHHGIGN